MDQHYAKKDDDADTKQGGSPSTDDHREGSQYNEEGTNYAYRDFSQTKCSDLRDGDSHEQPTRKLPGKLNAILMDTGVLSVKQLTLLPFL